MSIHEEIRESLGIWQQERKIKRCRKLLKVTYDRNKTHVFLDPFLIQSISLKFLEEMQKQNSFTLWGVPIKPFPIPGTRQRSIASRQGGGRVEAKVILNLEQRQKKTYQVQDRGKTEKCIKFRILHQFKTDMCYHRVRQKILSYPISITDTRHN